jgi:hypothetical protein
VALTVENKTAIEMNKLLTEQIELETVALKNPVHTDVPKQMIKKPKVNRQGVD